jgi:uncharacterized protein
MRAPFVIGGESIAAGSRQTVDLPLSLLSTHTPMTVPVHVRHGRRDGATLFISAAIHGDEIIGVEIIRQLLQSTALRHIRGTLICAPVVNVFGFIDQDRYLPDRRDLNRSFPGTERGSLAAQLANLFVTEIVEQSDVGIDLHSAAKHRVNLPQIRISENHPRAQELAEAFGAPVILQANLREGSLRECAHERSVDMIVYEAGEALRFDDVAIRTGVRGILRVMKMLDMLGSKRIKPATRKPYVVSSSRWVRAPGSGVVRLIKGIGDMVEEGSVIGQISDPIGTSKLNVEANETGVVIGQTRLPIVNQGDALLHIAATENPRHVETAVEKSEQEVLADPLLDEDEII